MNSFQSNLIKHRTKTKYLLLQNGSKEEGGLDAIPVTVYQVEETTYVYLNGNILKKCLELPNQTDMKTRTRTALQLQFPVLPWLPFLPRRVLLPGRRHQSPTAKRVLDRRIQELERRSLQGTRAGQP